MSRGSVADLGARLPAQEAAPRTQPAAPTGVQPLGRRVRRVRTRQHGRRGRWRVGVWAPPLVSVSLVGLLWTLVAARDRYLLPPLSEVALLVVTEPGLFLSNAWATLQIALAGLVVGFALAFALAVVVSEAVLLRRAVMPLATMMTVVPTVALAPALVVAFGFGMTPKVVLTALMTFFPVLVNVTTGLRSVPEPVLHVFTTLHASRWEVLVRLRVPASLPYTLAALRVVLPLSIIGAVVAEFLAAGSSSGLGTMIQTAASASRLAHVYAAVFFLALMGALTLVVIGRLEKRLLFWHESRQHPPT